MDFEVMIYNFTSGLQVVSFLHLAVSDLLDLPPVKESQAFLRPFEGRSWSDRVPSEPHVWLNVADIISFYNTNLLPSLIPAWFGKER